MKIEYYDACEYGNGAIVADEFNKQTVAKGLTVNVQPKPDKKTGRTPTTTEEELAKWQRITPSMKEILQSEGLITVVADKVLVTGVKGPLERDSQQKVESLVARLAIPQSRPKEPRTDPTRLA